MRQLVSQASGVSQILRDLANVVLIAMAMTTARAQTLTVNWAPAWRAALDAGDPMPNCRSEAGE